jgi:hypothetical protein
MIAIFFVHLPMVDGQLSYIKKSQQKYWAANHKHLCNFCHFVKKIEKKFCHKFAV